MPNLAAVLKMLLVFVLFNWGCDRQVPDKSVFVKVDGKKFVVDGKSYYFLGTNMWYGANLGALAVGGNRERLLRELDLLKSLGINNLRVMGASEGFSNFRAIDPTIQDTPGEYNETVLEGLDFLLAEMGKRKMYAVIYLNNFWEWSGGMSQYIAWLEKIPVPNPHLEQYDGTQFMKFSSRFYSHKEANIYFRNYLEFLIKRTNSFTCVKYKDDPVIMSWQLANEPRPGADSLDVKNFPAFLQWVDQTAKYIKSLDSNHLVSTGSEGQIGSLNSDSLYMAIHQFKSIDYLTAHLWMFNWRWYDPANPEKTYPQGKNKALAYLDQHIKFAENLNKPLVVEEFGMPRDLNSYDPESTTFWRDKYFNTVFQYVYDNAKSGGPLVGSNFWAWGGYGKAHETETAIWEKGDDFTGDPPQEAQGINSVFATDRSTLEILQKYADFMNEIN